MMHGAPLVELPAVTHSTGGITAPVKQEPQNVGLHAAGPTNSEQVPPPHGAQGTAHNAKQPEHISFLLS